MNRRWLRYVLLGLLIAAMAWGLQQIELQALVTVLRRAPRWALVAGVACNLVNLCGKASSWYFLLPTRPNYLRLIRFSVAAAAFSIVAPLRAGEGLRIWLLQQQEGIAPSATISVAVVEKMLNVLGLVVLVLPLPWLLPSLPGWVPPAMAACTGAVGVAGVGLVVASRRMSTERWPWLRATLGTLRRLGWNLLPAFACLLVGWLGDCALVALMLQACGIALDVLVVPYILFVINLAIVVPGTPAQVGTLELAAVGALQSLGIGHEAALAFGLLYHAVQIVPLLAVIPLEARLLRTAIRGAGA